MVLMVAECGAARFARRIGARSASTAVHEWEFAAAGRHPAGRSPRRCTYSSEWRGCGAAGRRRTTDLACGSFSLPPGGSRWWSLLVSPVAWLSGILFSVHIKRSTTLLLLVAAPLLTCAAPLLRDVGVRAQPREAIAPCFPSRAPHGPRVHAATRLSTGFPGRRWPSGCGTFRPGTMLRCTTTGIHALEHPLLRLAGSLFWWAW